MMNILCVLLAFPLFIFCVWTIFQFACFLSSQTYLHGPSEALPDSYYLQNGDPWTLLVIDIGLLSLFMLQHSLQARAPVKELLASAGIDVMERIIYNTTTCVTLQILMRFWQPVHSWAAWDLSTLESQVLWWIFTIIHGTAWATIYTGCLVLDLFELLGVKQIYYSWQGWPSPLNQKGKALLRLYKHMRHPGFTALTVISFVHPVMQADRLLLAYTFVIYMIFAFGVDQVDYTYHRKQLYRKKAELQISFIK